MERYEPLYAERHIAAFNVRLILAFAVLVLGLSTLPDGGAVLVFVGFGWAAFTWFTTPGQYVVFWDRLLVEYGRPRVRHVLFQEIDRLEMLPVSFGNRMRVRFKNGRRMIIQPRDLKAFESKLQDAIDAYRQNDPESRAQDRSR